MPHSHRLARPSRAVFLACGFAASLLCLTVATPAPAQDRSSGDLPAPPEPNREFRGVWVATVANIDWPSEPGLSTAEAKRELIAILDQTAELNLNAVVFQVRPAGDAMYRSELEPWSAWLTGEIGKAPSPRWDPLAFAVKEAHARGLELHAWFNPYRASHPSHTGEPVAPALSVRRPELVKAYGPYLWMDPAEPEVQQHSLEVILDVVRRYDIDGVHMDDYFYPYPRRDNGEAVPFPDDRSWSRYRDAGGRLSRDDWRRKAVNDFVHELYAAVKAEKPHVKVGISPFGIYRPGRPAFIRGFDQYEQLYADPLLWFQQGWLDYLTPQLYWPIAKPDQSFTALLQWWVDHNPAGRHVWPGIASYRHYESPDRYPIEEFVHQVRWSRYLTEVSNGHIHFSMQWLMPGDERKALTDRLREAVYAEPALVPATPWSAEAVDAEPPAAPTLRRVNVADDRVRVLIDADALDPDHGGRGLAQVRRGGTWHTATGLPGERSLVVETPGGGEVEAVTARVLDRYGRLGDTARRQP